MKEISPLEQQRIKIGYVREKMRGQFGTLFDEKEIHNERVNAFILQLETLEKNGLFFNKEEIIRGVKETLGVQDKEVFIANLLRILEPLIILKVTHSKIFEKIERDETINNSGYLRLSEVLYAGFKNEIVNIHLATATELIKKDGIGNFKKEIVNGFIKLAEIMKSDDKIKEVWAVSWLVVESPLFLQRLGFSIVGEISVEERKDHFSDSDETMPIAKAFMKREDFLARYGGK